MAGEERSAKRRKPEPKVIDLMEALQASVKQAKGGDGAQRPRRSRTAASGTKSRRRRRTAA
jgi:non-homologous end joining protein Ku